MRGMEVHLNGNKLCTAGIGGDAVLNTIVGIMARKHVYNMAVRIGGLDNNEFLVWSNRELKVGDEIKIRIIESESIDSPEQRTPNITE